MIMSTFCNSQHAITRTFLGPDQWDFPFLPGCEINMYKTIPNFTFLIHILKVILNVLKTVILKA